MAVAIFGVIAAIAYGSLATLISSKRGLEEHAGQLSDVQLALQLMQRDLAQAIDRPVRDQLGGEEAAMVVSGNGVQLAFTRLGEDIELLDMPRSRLERIEYQLRGETLWRVRWRQLDRVQGTRANEMLLMDQVGRWQLRFLDRVGDWHPDWPAPGQTAPLPAAVEVILEHPAWGTLRRVLVVQP